MENGSLSLINPGIVEKGASGRDEREEVVRMGKTMAGWLEEMQGL